MLDPESNLKESYIANLSLVCDLRDVSIFEFNFNQIYFNYQLREKLNLYNVF